MNCRRLCILALAVAVLLITQSNLRASDLPYTWVFISDMHCGHCAKKISTKLKALSGVAKVQCNVDQGFAVVTPKTGASLSPRAMWEAVEQIEFTPVKLQGPSGTFESKPDQ